MYDFLPVLIFRFFFPNFISDKLKTPRNLCKLAVKTVNNWTNLNSRCFATYPNEFKSYLLQIAQIKNNFFVMVPCYMV